MSDKLFSGDRKVRTQTARVWKRLAESEENSRAANSSPKMGSQHSSRIAKTATDGARLTASSPKLSHTAVPDLSSSVSRHTANVDSSHRSDCMGLSVDLRRVVGEMRLAIAIDGSSYCGFSAVNGELDVRGRNLSQQCCDSNVSDRKRRARSTMAGSDCSSNGGCIFVGGVVGSFVGVVLWCDCRVRSRVEVKKLGPTF